MANNDKENCGTTVHLVDASIDGGGILYQDRIQVTKKDNFTTYPYLQMAVGIKLMKLALYDLIQEKEFPKKRISKVTSGIIPHLEISLFEDY